jgi:hypothetical protein
VRRTRIDRRPQPAALFAGWRHHAFVTNRTGDAVDLDADHRAHAVVELAIRDLKHGAGLNHCPSGVFNANAAWLLAATLAHNLIRWTQLLGAPDTPRLPTPRPSAAAAHHPRPAHPHRPTMDPAPARPLALANRMPMKTSAKATTMPGSAYPV